MRIDVHTHAFPDGLAARALATLNAQLPPADAAQGDGCLGSLVAALEAVGFDRAVICSIATRPSHFQPILDWSCAIRDGDFGDAIATRIVPLASVHPEDSNAWKGLAEVARRGIKGIKLHAYYQGFLLDAPPVMDLLRCARDQGLVVVCHTGYDNAFPRDLRCEPARIRRVVETLPDLQFVATHMGAWQDWDAVEQQLIGLPLYIETSYSSGYLTPTRMAAMLQRHPIDRILFGTDWPWRTQAQELVALEDLGLAADRREALLGKNAVRLFGI